jgi:ABC-type transport system involved in multi-copper enzyme maturation permease subunit
LLIGPIFFREAATAPRRPRHYLQRSIYVLALLTLVCTAWFVLAGTQIIRNVGDMARFGSALFQILAPLQLALLAFLAAFGVGSAVAQEKDRRTLILLLMTRMTNGELVVGKLLASLLDVLVMLAAALPVFLLIALLGGVSHEQVARVFLVTLTTALVTGSLGSTLALWREKTFQTISMTALAIVLWVGLWEVVHSGLLFETLGGVDCRVLAAGFSPFRAIVVASMPRVLSEPMLVLISDGVNLYLLQSVILIVLLNGWAILRVRVWNPSREVRPGQADAAEAEAEAGAGSSWGAEPALLGQDLVGDAKTASADSAEVARSSHVDARQRAASRTSRRVWDNPVLWREVCTWAYGRKVLVVRIAYFLLFVLAAAGLYGSVMGSGGGVTPGLGAVIPETAKSLAPFFLVSLVIVNALAVNSITNERDALALDLLLVTDLSPREFVFGKLGGVLWVTKEMVVLPIVLCFYMWWNGGIRFENLFYLLSGLVVMNVFVTVLGIHCGMTYANSRTAIGVSLGAVFFLFVGVVTCLVIMISFSGSFHVQYAPFLAFVGGGSIGLYVALGFRNPSPAVFWASLLLPIATFFAIVSFVLGNRELTIFLVIAGMYGFTTLAMMIPAIAEFDIAMGRTKTTAEE